MLRKFNDSLKVIHELVKEDKVLKGFLILWLADIIVDMILTVWVIWHHLGGGN